MKHSLHELRLFAGNIRKNILKMTAATKSSHVGSSLSVVDLLTVLYGEILRLDPRQARGAGRDVLLYSKGHASAALYATLAEFGFIEKPMLEEYYRDGGRLAGHPVMDSIPGVEISTGSLGHGLPIGVGMALARKRDGNPARVFVVMSDGECDEGSVWEAAMFAGFHGLDNLTAVIDYNKIQSLGSTEEVLDLEPLVSKWRAFNWSVGQVNGHDRFDIYNGFYRAPYAKGRPTVLIAHTVKGKGVSFMENRLEWHYKSPDPDQLARALKEVDEA